MSYFALDTLGNPVICTHKNKKAEYYTNGLHHCKKCWDKIFTNKKENLEKIKKNRNKLDRIIEEICK